MCLFVDSWGRWERRERWALSQHMINYCQAMEALTINSAASRWHVDVQLCAIVLGATDCISFGSRGIAPVVTSRGFIVFLFFHVCLFLPPRVWGGALKCPMLMRKQQLYLSDNRSWCLKNYYQLSDCSTPWSKGSWWFVIIKRRCDGPTRDMASVRAIREPPHSPH